MINIELEDIVSRIFQGDLKENGQYTHISQLGIITIKSLVPARESLGNKIDYRRFYEELKLWWDYRGDESKDLLNDLRPRDAELYFTRLDKTIFYRLIPIIVANEDFSIMEDELIKNVLFTTGNIDNLFEGLLVGIVLDMLIKGEDDIVDQVKDYIINFSQVDFIDRYGDYYKIPVSHYRDYPIQLERKRIEVLNLLNQLPTKNFPVLKDILNILDGGKAETFIGKAICLAEEDSQNAVSLNNFHREMNSYILRLRKSRIEPEKLIIREYWLPDVFSFEEGEVFYHSLLNKSRVIKKEVSNKLLTSIIETKAGMYKFKRDLN